MGKYDIDIADNSVWVTATPAGGDITMPFYITEIGHFYAGDSYNTDRAGHDSYMMLYTIKGSGMLETDKYTGEIREGEAVVFDCHTPHRYRINGDRWEFMWIHFRGICAGTMVNAVNYNGVHTVKVRDMDGFYDIVTAMMKTADKNDILAMSAISANIHAMLDILLRDTFDGEDDSGGLHVKEIKLAVKFIEENYMNPVSIDAITDYVHVSKYYFIRLFRQYMGMTPYSYLINYRINRSKILLRSSKYSVGEISGMTGFLDVSNYITQFKKQTGQKPMDYRKRFM